MKLIYISSLCSKNKYSELFAGSGSMPGMQAQKYNRLMAEGLAQNDGISLTALSAAPVNRSNCKKLFFSEKDEVCGNITYKYIPFINLPVIKNLCLIFNSRRICKRLIKENPDAAAVCDVLSLSASYGALKAIEKTGNKSAGIITDLPDFLKSGNNKAYMKLYEKTTSMCKSYVLMTEQMNKKINPDKKPYRVIEGQSDISMISENNSIENKFSKKICMYAGGIEEEYGLKILAEGFAKASIEGSELWIYGHGSYAEELKNFCKEHPTVIYKGLAPNDEIVKTEQKAWLLINPRPSSGEFTEYSFPSKNLEYMASGTPLLAAKLPGMPDEYKDYIYIVANESADGIAECLTEILGKSAEELYEKGALAKEFVLKRKNNTVQAGKVLELLV